MHILTIFSDAFFLVLNRTTE